MSGRGDRSCDNTVGAYWELVQLIFTAFHLDQSQNTFCATYFTTNQQSNILNYKVALDIVQVVLNKCEIASGKLEDDVSPAITPTRGSIDWLNRSSIDSGTLIHRQGSLDASMNASIDVDTTGWDPFLDADKFEKLAAKKAETQKKRNKAQIARILHPRESFSNMQSIEKSDDLENKIVHVEERLAQKDSQLKLREDIQKKLEDDKSLLELQLQQKSAELQKMQRTINEKELTIRIEQSEAKKAMHMIDELKDVVKSNKQLQAEVEQKTSKIQKLEADKQRLKEENRIGLNSQRNMELEDLGLNFRVDDDDEVIRKPGNEKAFSDNFFGLQTGLTMGSQTTEIERAENELEAMTGSFVMAANNKNVPTTEDEYFQHQEESFVSRGDEFNRSTNTEIVADNDLFDNSYISPEQESPVQMFPEEETKEE